MLKKAVSIKRALFLLAVANLFTSFKSSEITWVAIGDSITYLNDHTNETGNRVTKGYLTDVTEQMPGFRYINKGYNGWTSGNIAARIDSLGLVKAEVYSIFLGTNDWWQGRPVGNLEDYKNNIGNTSVYGSFRIIINKIHRLNPQAKIVLITPMQRADFVYINNPKNNAFGSYKPKNGQYLEAFADAINTVGRYEGIPVVDLYNNELLKIENLVKFKRLKDPKTGLYINYMYPESTNVAFNPSTDDFPYPKEAIALTYDGLHPSNEGNAVIASAIVHQFKQLALVAETIK